MRRAFQWCSACCALLCCMQKSHFFPLRSEHAEVTHLRSGLFPRRQRCSPIHMPTHAWVDLFYCRANRTCRSPAFHRGLWYCYTHTVAKSPSLLCADVTLFPRDNIMLVRKESARVKSLPVYVPEFARLIVPT